MRHVTPAAAHPRGTKTASQTPATGQSYLDVPTHGTKQANLSLMQDLRLPPHIQAATEALLTQKAAAILGPLAIQALGPGAPQMTGPNANGQPEIPLMQPQGAEAGPGGQVPAPAAAQIAPPMGTPGAPVPPDPSQAQGQAPAAAPPPNPMAPAPMMGKAAVTALGDLPGQMGAPAGMGQAGPDVGAGAMGAASSLPSGTQPGGMQAGGLGTGLPPQVPGQQLQPGAQGMAGASAQPSTVPSRMGSSALAPVGLNPLPGSGAPPEPETVLSDGRIVQRLTVESVALGWVEVAIDVPRGADMFLKTVVVTSLRASGGGHDSLIVAAARGSIGCMEIGSPDR